MINRSRGFSLIELLLALATTLALSAMMFHLFQHNERVVRDRTLVMDMQQTARVVASQIADEIRMAGQGVPVHSSKFDTAMVESMAVVLPASTNSRIDFRAGLSDAESAVTGVPPLDVTLNLQSTVSVNDGSAFSAALGTTLPSGKFIYLWGAASNSTWTWVRAELNAVTSASLTITPRQTSNTNNTIRFIRLPTVTLEEAVSIYLSGNSVRRATATDMSNPASPQWSAANEIGEELHCSELHLLRLIRQRCRPDFTGESYFNRTGRCSIDGSNSRQTQHRQTADAFIKAEDNSQKSAATLSKLILSECENSPCRRQGQLATDAVHGNKTGGLSSG